MAAILHVTKPGHKCPSSGLHLPPASYCKAGEVYALNGWALSYDNRQRAYIVHRDEYPYGRWDYYQFTNYNCAAAKLAELGK
jgi:hypothetical protein